MSVIGQLPTVPYPDTSGVRPSEAGHYIIATNFSGVIEGVWDGKQWESSTGAWVPNKSVYEAVGPLPGTRCLPRTMREEHEREQALRNGLLELLLEATPGSTEETQATIDRLHARLVLDEDK